MLEDLQIRHRIRLHRDHDTGLGANPCGPQEIGPSLSGLFFQAIFVMQPAKNWCRFDLVRGRQLVSV